MAEPAFTPVATFEEIVGAINECQRSGGASSAGEKLSAAILEKTEDELATFANKLDNDAGNTLVYSLAAAEESLKQRHHLVVVAMARLGMMVQQDQGGDHA